MTMKTMFVIKNGEAMGSVFYVKKRYPRRCKGGTNMCALTPRIKDVRKFRTFEDAKKVLDDFTPSVFSGKEKIVEIQ
jgi:hypothetical protein